MQPGMIQTVINEYPANGHYSGHHYVETWESTSLFCPRCGKQAVWKQEGEGDYYLGPEYLCTECNNISCLDHSAPATTSNKLAVIDQIKKRQKNTPKTPKGG
jgi:hypothetical protein